MQKAEEGTVIQECVNRLKTGELAPWKGEEEIAETYGIPLPDNFRTAALCRQRFIEDETGERFSFITVPEKPYKIRYRCENDNFITELEAQDDNLICSLCGSELRPLDEYAPLVASYVGGCDDYYSFAGRIRIRGDLERELTNLLVYGTGLGPIGVTRGCYLINRAGGALPGAHLQDSCSEGTGHAAYREYAPRMED
jgi:hypothetical protein